MLCFQQTNFLYAARELKKGVVFIILKKERMVFLIHIIPYEAHFQRQVVSLILYIQNRENHLHLTLTDQPDFLDIEGYYLKAHGGFWIAEENGKVIGTIGCKRMNDSGCVLKKFFVHREFRGRKIGLQLYNTFLAFCHGQHLHQIVLDTPSIATRSHRFYRQAGFHEITKDQLPFPYSYPDRQSLLFLKEI